MVSVRTAGRPFGEVSEHYKENARQGWPRIWNAHVSRPPLETLTFWQLLAKCEPSVAPKKLKLKFPSILRKHGRNGPKWGVLMNPDNFQKLFAFRQHLLSSGGPET